MKKIILIFSLFLVININAQFKVYDPLKLIVIEGQALVAPSYSPDGKYVMFTKDKYQGIYLYNTNDKSIFTVTDEEAAGFGAKWSSNSEMIVFRGTKDENGKHLNAVKLYNLTSKTTKELTEYRATMAGLPDFASSDEKVTLCSRGILEVFETGVKSLNKTPQASKIAYIKNNKIAVGDVLDKSDNLLDIFGDGRVINLVKSSDGSRIAFEVIGKSAYVMNIDGSNLVDLGVKAHRPKFSSDSKYVVYQVTEDDGQSFTSSEIFVSTVDGKFQQNLSRTNDLIEMNPSFSPDGKSIVFDLENDGAIYSMNIE